MTHPFFLRSFDPHTSFPAFLLPFFPSPFLPSFIPLFLSPPTHHPFISLSIHPSLQLPPSCSSFSLPSGLWSWTRNSTVGQTSLGKLLTFVHHPLCVWAVRTPAPASRRGLRTEGWSTENSCRNAWHLVSAPMTLSASPLCYFFLHSGCSLQSPGGPFEPITWALVGPRPW